MVCKAWHAKLVENRAARDVVIELRDKRGLTIAEIGRRLNRHADQVRRLYRSAPDIESPLGLDLDHMSLCDCPGGQCRKPADKLLAMAKREERQKAEAKRTFELREHLCKQREREAILAEDRRSAEAERVRLFIATEEKQITRIRDEIKNRASRGEIIDCYEIGCRHYLPSVMIREIAQACGVDA